MDSTKDRLPEAGVGNCSKQFFVKSGNELVDADEPIYRFVVLTDPKRTKMGFASVHVSHADGHTFYAG